MSRRRLLYFVTALAGLILLAGVAGLLTVRSTWFHDQVRERIIFEVEKATGGRAELGSFAFDWKTMSATVKDFTLHGKEPAGEAPLFQGGSIRVGLKVISAFRRDVDIASLELDRPHLNILVNKDGTTNLPSPAVAGRSTKNAIEQVIALAVGRIEVRDGVARYDSKTLPLEVSGQNLRATLDYETIGQRYVGSVVMNPVQVKTVGVRPFSLDRVESSVAIEGNAIRFPQTKLALQQTTLEASGIVQDFKNLSAEFRVKARGAMAEIGPIVRSPLRPDGTGTFEGTVKLGAGRPIEIAGTVEGQGLGYTYGSWRVRNARASASVHFTPARLDLTDLRVAALDGSFRGTASLEDLRLFRVKGNIQGFSLRRLSEGQLTRPLAWSGTVSGPVEIQGAIYSSRIGDSTVAAKLLIEEAEGGIALSGALDLAYAQREGRLKLGSSWLQTAASRLNLEGTLGERLHIGLVSSDLNDALPALALLSDNPPQRMPVDLQHGEARFEGWVTGSLDHPQVAGNANLTNFVYEGQHVDSVAANIEVADNGLRAKNLKLAQGSLRIEGEGTLGLTSWKVGDDPAISGKFAIRNADIQSLLQGSNQNLPLRGVVDAGGSVSGTLKSMKGTAHVEVANLYLSEQRFDRGTADITYENNTLHVASGTLQSDPAKISLQGTWTHPADNWKGGSVKASVQATALPLSKVAWLQQMEAGVEGSLDVTVSVAAQLQGDRPRLTALDGRAALKDLKFDSTPLGAVAVDAATEGQSVKLSASGNLRNSKVAGEGVFDLQGDYPGHGKVTLSRLDFTDLEPLLTARFPTGLPFRGFLQAGATFDGPLLSPEGLRAQARLDTVEVRPRERERLGPKIEITPDLVLRNAAPIALSIDRKGISVQNAEFVARDTDFYASGILSLGSKNPWDLKLKGKVNLTLLNSFDPDVQAAGTSTLDATVRGSLSQPQINGRMELANASFYLRGLPNGIEKANGVILFDRNRANVDKLTAQTGGGEISLGGFIGLGANELIYRLQANASRVRVRYPEGVSTTVDANLNLTGTSLQSLLVGTITVIRSGFTPRTDLGSILAQASKPIPAPSTPNEFVQGLQFDIRVDTAPDVQFQTSLTRDLQMEATLRLRGSPNKPVLLGNVNVNRGEIQFFGNKYTISRGEISFFNAAKIEPVLNMDLETRVRAVTVNINFSGPIDKLNVTYRSDPPLQSSEIIALLTVGRTPSASDPNQASEQQQSRGNQSLFQTSANSLLGQAVAAPVSSRLERFFGVSRLKIDPQLTGIDNTPQARVTLEQQISKDITLTYATSLTRSQQQLVQLEWNISQEWSVVAVRDENGVFGIDFQYRRRIR